MKGKFLFILFGFIIVLYLSPLFREGIFQTHDGENHMARIASFSQSLKDGQFPVRWAGDLNYSLGSPVFIFFYPLPYALSFIFHFLGFGITDSFKLVLLLTFVLSFFSFLLFIRFFVRREVALVGSLLYMITPYHLLNLYVRGDVGELLAYTFLPLVFASIEGFRRKPDVMFLIAGGISYGLVVLSHNGVSLIFTPVIALYILLFLQGLKNKLFGSFIIPIGLLLSSFFWIPALIESRYTNARFFIGEFYNNNFISLLDTIHSSWGFGADVHALNGQAPQIGVFYFLLSFLSVILGIRYRKNIPFLVFWGLIFLFGIFLSTGLSFFAWERIVILKLFQFPWRMIVFSTVASVILVSLLLNYVRSTKILFLILLIFLLSTITFIQTRKSVVLSDEYYYSFPGTTYFHGEASTIWSAGDGSVIPPQRANIVEGRGEIVQIEEKSDKHIYRLRAETDVNVLDNTTYFPGWKVIGNGVEREIQFQDPAYPGLITYRIPKGEYYIETDFGESKVRLLSNILSLCGIIIVVLIVIGQKRINNKIK